MDVDLEACIRGDKKAWDVFVDRWAGVIHAAVQRAFKSRRSFVDRADVEDTVQDVFVRLLKDGCRLLKTYDPNRASLSTWLTLVARSVAIDRLRKRREPTLPIEPHDVIQPAPDPEPAASVSVPVHLLSPRQRLVLRLLFDEQMSVPEAARFVGVDEQTIRSTKHKALTRLREHFSSIREPVSGDGGRPDPVQPPRETERQQ